MSPRTHTQWEEIRGKSREKIVNAAISLFSSVGYFSTSVSKIAKKAGVSKGLLYNYFESKDQLLVAIVKKTFKLLEDAFATDKTQNKTPQEELLQIIENMLDLIIKNQGFLRMLIPLSMQIREFDFLRNMIYNKYSDAVLTFSKLLVQLNYPNPEGEARILIATLDGIMYQYLVIGDNLPFEEIKKELLLKYNKN